jgi:hypothetical protein
MNLPAVYVCLCLTFCFNTHFFNLKQYNMKKSLLRSMLTGTMFAAAVTALAQQQSFEVRNLTTIAPGATGGINPGSPSPYSFAGTNTWDGQGAGTGGNNNAHFGYFSGRLNTATGSTFVGSQSGYNHTTGFASTFVGYTSGLSTTTGSYGAFFGTYSGQANTTGFQNTFIGSLAGYLNTTGVNNTSVGHFSGGYNTTGQSNTYLGSYAGLQCTGSNNVMMGTTSGYNNLSGSGNVFIGHQSGYYETGSGKLHIDNAATTVPLIFGDFAIDKLVFNGKTSIGTANQPTSVGSANTSAYNLFVKGGILSDEVRVRIGWADYVFDKDYELKPLGELEAFIKTNKHLPNVPSASQVAADGLNLGDISRIQQEKIEELTLYVIDQNKQLKAQQKEIAELKAMVQKLLK